MQLAAISWTFGLEDLNDLFYNVKEIGYTSLQFCGDFEKYDATAVVAISKEYGVALTCYDPLNCKPKTATDATLQKSVVFYKKVIDYAVAIGAPICTLQGLSFWTKNQPNYDAALQQISEAVLQLSDYAKVKNMLLSYEACNHYEVPQGQTAEELLRIYNGAGRPKNVKLVLDSFHMNITEKDMVNPIKKLGEKLLCSYHVSDSGRGGIGTGSIDYLIQFKTLKQIGFDGLVCFEIVLPECRPNKLPMNEAQLEKFKQQSKNSLTIWQGFMKNDP
ncbi:sugar phosphate isomerase/epimerase family protein [Zhouia sp. PK063]|uniref:sugar phosphate isomerase/epimerase family protein n=1 Tax=Zhouia sp. PK063 TaxID=3373602 RepID=UPI0037900034